MNHYDSITLKFKTSDILAKIRENRSKHVAEFLEADKGFRQAWIDELKQKLSEAQAGFPIKIHTKLVKLWRK